MKVAKSKTKDGLLKLINEYYYTTSCIITDNDGVVNTKLNKTLGVVKFVRGSYEYHTT